MADYAYFIENVGIDNRDNTRLFNRIRELYIDENEVYLDTEDSKEELEKLLNELDYQDRLVVRSVTDLADTAKSLLDTFFGLQEKGVVLESIEEPYISRENYYIVFKDFIRITKYYAEKKRQQGYQEAKEKSLVGRPAKSDEDIEKAIKLYKSKMFTIAEIEDLTKFQKQLYIDI